MAISKNLKFKNSYSVESLYEAIKDHPFTAGQPSLTRHGALMITFPPLDSHNQVQIIKGSLLGKESQKFVVQKGEAAGMKNMAKNIGLDILTDSWANKRSIIGSTAEQSSQLVDITAEELEAMNL